MITRIFGGTVIDPANGVHGVLDITFENGKILAVGEHLPAGDRNIDATGKIVTPGFVDIHLHEDPIVDGHLEPCIFPMMLRQGVTTAVGGNCGINVADPVSYLALVEREGAAVNVALYAGHEYFRKEAGAADIYGGATQAQLERMEENLQKALDAGCVGVSFGLRYVPGADKEEFFRAAATCRKGRKLIASHVRDDADGVFAAIDEFCAAGTAFDLPVQISHIGSMAGFGQMARVLAGLDAAAGDGLDVMLDCYPYFAFSTRIGTPTYDPGWLDRYHTGYEVLEFCEGKYRGQRATAETFAEIRSSFPECITVCHVMQEADIRLAFRHPRVMLGSDGLMNQGQGHPRAAGAFPRFLRQFALDGELSLDEAIGKMTVIPADRLGFAQKGRLSVGADADITVFDPATLRDGATFENPALPPQGIEYVFLGGKLALEQGEIVNATLGKALRK